MLAGFQFSRYRLCNRLQSNFRDEELDVTEIGIGILGDGMDVNQIVATALASSQSKTWQDVAAF